MGLTELRRRCEDAARAASADGFAARPALERLALLESAADCLSKLAERSGDATPLYRAIEFLERAVDVAPAEDIRQGMTLEWLLSTLGSLYRLTGKRSVLKHAAAVIGAWNERVPHDWRAPVYVMAFGMVPYHVAMASGRERDIANAIAVLEGARSMVGPGSGVHGTTSSLLAELRLELYRQTAAPEHLQAAIDDAVSGGDSSRTRDADRNRALRVLAWAMLARFEALRSVSDLDAVIAVATRALEHDLARGARLSLLDVRSTAQRYRFHERGDRADLDASISTCRTLLEAANAPHERAKALDKYANALADRFGVTHDAADLRAALAAARAALKRLEAGTPDHALVASNLGRTLLDGYRVTRDARHLREATRVLERGVRARSRVPDVMPRLHMALADAYLHQAARSRTPAPLLRRALRHLARTRERATGGEELPLSFTLVTRARLLAVADMEVSVLLRLAALSPRSAPRLLRQAIETGEEAKGWTAASQAARGSLPQPPGVPAGLLDRESWLLGQLAGLDNTELVVPTLGSGAWLSLVSGRRRELLRELRGVWKEMVNVSAEAAAYVRARLAPSRAWMESFARRERDTAAIAVMPTSDVRRDGSENAGLAILAVRPGLPAPVLIAWQRESDPVPEAVRRLTREIPEDAGNGFCEETWFHGLTSVLGSRLPGSLDDVSDVIVSPSRHGNNLPWQLAFQRVGWRRADGSPLPVVTVPTLAILQDSEPSDGRRTRRLPWVNVLDPKEAMRTILRGANPRIGPLVVGDPNGNLAGSATEASEIARLLGVDPLIGELATVDDVMRALGSAPVIHLAGHAYLDQTDAMDSVIHLADGNITARDLVTAFSEAELVVLSACEGGATQAVLGGEIAGLSHTFLRAGAGAVVAGLWRVDDHATAFLMTAFYRALLAGAQPAEALQRAMQLTSEQSPWKLPYYWSAFVIAQSRASRELRSITAASSTDLAAMR